MDELSSEDATDTGEKSRAGVLLAASNPPSKSPNALCLLKTSSSLGMGESRGESLGESLGDVASLVSDLSVFCARRAARSLASRSRARCSFSLSKSSLVFPFLSVCERDS